MTRTMPVWLVATKNAVALRTTTRPSSVIAVHLRIVTNPRRFRAVTMIVLQRGAPAPGAPICPAAR
ncbi:hypothetical protein D3C80_2184160 [compost metagenome]